MEGFINLILSIVNQIWSMLRQASPAQLLVLSNTLFCGLFLIGWLHGIWLRRATIVLLILNGIQTIVVFGVLK